MSNPLDDYLAGRPARPMIEKRAFGFGQMARTSMQEGAAQAVGQGAVGLAAAGIGMAAMKTYRALRKRKDFKEMLQVNPDLAEFQEQDPMKFNAHYNSLRTMNPGYAEDPIISGTLMRTMSMNPNSAGAHLMQSLESASKTMGRPQPPFQIGSRVGDKGQETSANFRF